MVSAELFELSCHLGMRENYKFDLTPFLNQNGKLPPPCKLTPCNLRCSNQSRAISFKQRCLFLNNT